MNVRDYLIAIAIIHEGKWHDIYRALDNKEEVSDEVVNNYFKHMKCNALTILDSDYPEYLRIAPYPPFVLFYYGDISLIKDNNKNIAVVGSRNATIDGLRNVDYIVSGIAKEYNIVSGLALGVDAAAHRAALFSGGRTIAVLGNGIEYCYPSANSDLYKTIREKHLVISEYYNYISPDPGNFHQRNRLIAGFAKATIIGESHLRSGTLITANQTMQQFKELMAIPSSNIFDSLNNELIRDGAAVILSPEDVFLNLDKARNSLLCKVK